MWTAVNISVPGKWILAGEHAVLKGMTAIALPEKQVCLSIEFIPASAWALPSDASDLMIEPLAVQEEIQSLVDFIFEQVIGDGLPLCFRKPKGRLRIESTIPMQAGLGSSAALCVALTRWIYSTWFQHRSDWVDRSIAVATQLECRFHGKSSGLDVAVIAREAPILFQMNSGLLPLSLQKLPHWTLHDTGLRSQTHECVAKVEWFRNTFAHAFQIDEQMGAASLLAHQGLLQYDLGFFDQGLEWIQEAMHRAHACFEAWDLIPTAVQAFRTDLLQQGALAVKLTGAGQGGMLVALWHEIPSVSPNLEFQ